MSDPIILKLYMSTSMLFIGDLSLQHAKGGGTDYPSEAEQLELLSQGRGIVLPCEDSDLEIIVNTEGRRTTTRLGEPLRILEEDGPFPLVIADQLTLCDYLHVIVFCDSPEELDPNTINCCAAPVSPGNYSAVVSKYFRFGVSDEEVRIKRLTSRLEKELVDRYDFQPGVENPEYLFASIAAEQANGIPVIFGMQIILQEVDQSDKPVVDRLPNMLGYDYSDLETIQKEIDRLFGG